MRDPCKAKESDAVVTSPSRTTRYAWFIAFMLSAAYLLSIMDRYIMSVVLESVKSDLSLSDTQLGILQGPSFVILFLIASVPFGRMADVLRRRELIVAGLLIWSAATAACGLASTFAGLLAARLLVGLGEAALMPAAMSLISAYFSRDQLSRGVAVYSAGATFGRAAAFAGGGALFTWFGINGGLILPVFGELNPWRSVFMVAGVAGVAFTGVFFVACREPPRAARPAAGASLRDGLAFFWRRRIAYLAVFMPFAMVSAIAVLLASWSVSFYVREHGMEVAKASALVGFTGLAVGPTAALIAGWLNDKLRSRGLRSIQPLMLSAILPLATAAMMVLMLAPSVTLAALAYGAAYFILTLAGPTGLSGIQLLTPDVHRGTLSSLGLVFYTGLAAFVGPLLVGLYGDLLFGGSDLAMAMLLSTFTLAVVGMAFGLLGRLRFREALVEIEARSAASQPP